MLNWVLHQRQLSRQWIDVNSSSFVVAVKIVLLLQIVFGPTFLLHIFLGPTFFVGKNQEKNLFILFYLSCFRNWQDVTRMTLLFLDFEQDLRPLPILVQYFRKKNCKMKNFKTDLNQIPKRCERGARVIKSLKIIFSL